VGAAVGVASIAAAPVGRLPVSAARRSDTGNQRVSDTGSQANALTAADDPILAVLANQELDNERFDNSEWRVEVYTNRNGRRYWNHRRRGKRGGKANWKFGGKFDELDPERQAQYWQRTKGG